MIKKMILGATLSLFALTASASSLTLASNEPSQINVTCNGQAGLPIPAAGKLTLPYILIATRFLSKDLNCTFTDGSGQVGHAHFVISGPFSNLAQVVSYDPKNGVNIEPASALTTPTGDITVTLSKL